MTSEIKRVLVGLTIDENGFHPGAMNYGASIAATFGAHLTVRNASYALTTTHEVVSEEVGGDMEADDQACRRAVRIACERIKVAAGLAGHTCDVNLSEFEDRDFASEFAQQARVQDLVVLDLQRQPLTLERGLIEDLLLRGGRPLLLVPAHRDSCVLDRVLVAWDASGPAARAVADAMPLLQRAGEVEILSIPRVDDEATAAPGTDLAEWLAAHGIRVTLRQQQAGGTAGETVLSRAAESGADLIVMGGYHHTRLREFIIGGATNTVLAGATTPVLLSH